MKRQSKMEALDDKHFIRHKFYEDDQSAAAKYKTLVVGDRNLITFLRYELISTLLAPIPGAAGLFLRRFFFPTLFDKIQKGVIFGKNCVFRHPAKIKVGARVIFDDYCLVCARGADADGVVIGDNVMINRGAVIQAKLGNIEIGHDSSIGTNSYIASQGGIRIGSNVRVAGGCYISGGASKLVGDQEIVEERYTKGPIRIDDDAHIGMGAIILDNVHIQQGAIVGPGSVVMTNVPKHAVVMGNPAKIWRMPKKNESTNKPDP